MISFAEAGVRANEIMDRLDLLPPGPTDETVSTDLIVVQCVGTDVPGDELVEQLKGSCGDTMRLILAAGHCDCEDSCEPALNCTAIPVVVGMLNKLFWLGYAFGEAADR